MIQLQYVTTPVLAKGLLYQKNHQASVVVVHNVKLKLQFIFDQVIEYLLTTVPFPTVQAVLSQ